MASTISAGTTSGTAINISGDTSGNLQFQTQAGTNTITVPNATGTMMVSGNMPAFYYYQTSANTSLGNQTTTKITYDTKGYDTANSVSSSVFQPTVAGYYQINAGISISTASFGCFLWIYKNSSVIAQTFTGFQVGVAGGTGTVSGLVYLNGSTDTCSIYAYQSSGTTQTTNTGAVTFFNGVLVRAA